MTLAQPRSRSHGLSGFAAMLLAACPAQAAGLPVPAPLPPTRAAVLGPPVAMHREVQGPPWPGPPKPAAPPDDAFCAGLLAGGTIKATALPPIPGQNGCGLAHPVRVEAVLARGGPVAIEPPLVADCPVAAAVAGWIRDDIAPFLAGRGDRPVALGGVNGYECRSRNRVAGEKLSEHATGNALDIRSLRLASGRIADITRPGDDPALLALMQRTACARFTTVLGPGADAFHATNLHLDLRQRAHGFRLCEWTLP